LRRRIERACVRQEIVFGAKLPAGGPRERLVSTEARTLKWLTEDSELYSDHAFRERRQKDLGYLREEIARHLGWIGRIIGILPKAAITAARCRESLKRLAARFTIRPKTHQHSDQRSRGT
jgi:hypothetical protein